MNSIISQLVLESLRFERWVGERVEESGVFTVKSTYSMLEESLSVDGHLSRSKEGGVWFNLEESDIVKDSSFFLEATS